MNFVWTAWSFFGLGAYMPTFEVFSSGGLTRHSSPIKANQAHGI